MRAKLVLHSLNLKISSNIIYLHNVINNYNLEQTYTIRLKNLYSKEWLHS